MAMTPEFRRSLTLLADLLSYPTPETSAQARACAQTLAAVDAEAAARVAAFAEWAAETPLTLQEELFTRTFDLQAICFPYIGYHLFGESYKRGGFLARLQGEYRRRGMPVAGELPDHLALVLRFLAAAEEDEVTRDLAEFCLAPALPRMDRAFGGQPNPYRPLIQALMALFPPAAANLSRAEDAAWRTLPLTAAPRPADAVLPPNGHGCGPNCTHLKEDAS